VFLATDPNVRREDKVRRYLDLDPGIQARRFRLMQRVAQKGHEPPRAELKLDSLAERSRQGLRPAPLPHFAFMTLFYSL
jgi:hypothetical protein